jgi:hypothetical protein
MTSMSASGAGIETITASRSRFRLRLAQFDDEISMAKVQERQQFGEQVRLERRNDVELQLAFEQPAAMAGEINKVGHGPGHDFFDRHPSKREPVYVGLTFDLATVGVK